MVNRTVPERDLRSRARLIALIAYVPALMLPCGCTQGLTIVGCGSAEQEVDEKGEGCSIKTAI
jgi:hypothetical protein